MVKLAMLKKVILPNGRSFYATYKMVTQDALPNNVRIRRTYRIQAAIGPRSRGIKDILVKGFRIAKRLATSSVGRERGKIAMEDAARAYETGVRRVRNIRLKRIPQSDLANSAMDMGRACVYDKLA